MKGKTSWGEAGVRAPSAPWITGDAKKLHNANAMTETLVYSESYSGFQILHAKY